MRREIIILTMMSLLLSTIIMIQAEGQGTQGIDFRSLKVYSNISDHYHMCNITMEVYNPGDDLVETVFSFDIPESGLLTEMTVEMDGILYRSEVKEKEEAKDEYDQAVERGDSAFLLERALNWNQFTFSLGVKPGESANLSVYYGQIMKMYLGAYDLEIPISSISNYEKFDIVDVSVKADLNEMVELKTERSTIEFTRNKDDTDGFELVYHTMTPQKNDNVFITYTEANTPENGIVRSTVYGNEGYFMHIFSPSVDVVGSYLPKDVVIVLDKSGSMSGNKISTVKSSFSEIVDQFNENDRFNIILFDTATTSFKGSLTEASESRKSEAERYIKTIDANGGTNIGAGLSKGIKEFSSSESSVPVLIFLTDGLPTAGEENTLRLRETVKQNNRYGAVIHTLGYGTDHDANFLKAIALENEGQYRYVKDDEDASQLLMEQYSSVSSPLLKDLEFEYSSNTYDVIGDNVSVLFEGSEVVVLGKYHVNDTTLEMNLDSRYHEGEKLFSETYDLANDESSMMIPRLWAHMRISQLLDDIFVEDGNETKEAEVVSLALEFSFVTPYTSFVLVVDDTDMNSSQVDENKIPKLDDVDTAPLSDPNLGWGGGAPSYDIGEAEDMTILPLLCMVLIIGIIVVIIVVAIVVSSRKKSKEINEDEKEETDEEENEDEKENKK